jgi:Serine dehydrogenase proteinase
LPSVWDTVNAEFVSAQQLPRPPGARAFWADIVETRIQRVYQQTGVPLIIYASACTAPAGKAAPELLTIDSSDKIGFHSMLEGLSGPKLDVLIHSPGGTAEATESIVEEIRRKFNHVRFIIPSFAKSAATIMAMSGDEILMDEDAELGPIDPQFITRNGVVAGEAIKEQFKKASEEILSDAKLTQVWFPILQMLGPGLLAQCDNAIELSKTLVRTWLAKYMFRALPDADKLAGQIADYLGNHQNFLSHGRRVKLEHLRTHGLVVRNLREDAPLYQAVWELYCAIDLLLSNTPAFKVLYNSTNTSMVRQNVAAQNMFGFPFMLPGFPPGRAPGLGGRQLPAPTMPGRPPGPTAPAAPEPPARGD